MIKYYLYRGWYSPLNGTIEDVVCGDPDLHFQDEQFLIVNTSEIVQAGTKMRDTTLIEFDICDRMIPLRMLYSITLTWIFKVKYLKH